MSYLVDTSLIVAYLRGDDAAAADLQARSSAGLAASAISVGELYEGVFRARDVQAAERVLKNFLQDVEVVPVDEASAREFGRIGAQLRGHSREGSAGESWSRGGRRGCPSLRQIDQALALGPPEAGRTERWRAE